MEGKHSTNWAASVLSSLYNLPALKPRALVILPTPKMRMRDWRDNPVEKSAYGSSKGLESCSQHSHQEAHNPQEFDTPGFPRYLYLHAPLVLDIHITKNKRMNL